MPIRRVSSLLQPIAAVILMVVCAAVVQTRRHTPTRPPPPVAPPAVSARLIRAGSTLYWTVNQGDEHRVYAMIPPERPRLLYREHGDLEFGDLEFGVLASLPRLAIVVNELATGSARIQLLPLPPGGRARTLAMTRRIVMGDLLTDGARLLWADDQGLQAIPAAGGPIRTLTR